jgi:Protein of unknown function (DUF2630)
MPVFSLVSERAAVSFLDFGSRAVPRPGHSVNRVLFIFLVASNSRRTSDEETVLEDIIMKDYTTDQPVFSHIQNLVTEEHRLYAEGAPAPGDRERLSQVKIELDQCWDLLRQRRALREAGHNPNDAQVRPAKVVENYEQ